MASKTEIVGWINRPGYSGVVVKEDGKLISLDFTKINQLLDRIDKKSWEERYWQVGCMDNCPIVPKGRLEPAFESNIKHA